MKILVTGAAGFIGSHLTESLARVGHQIIALDALLPDLYPIEQKVRNWELLGELGSNVERRKIDLRLPLDASEIEECDFIFHLAAMPGLSLSWEDTKLYIDCNVLALANLIKATNPEKLKRFFHISILLLVRMTILSRTINIPYNCIWPLLNLGENFRNIYAYNPNK